MRFINNISTMPQTEEPIKTTTVSVDAATRERINAEAARLGLNQREMIQRLIEGYDLAQQRDGDADEQPDSQTLLQQVNDTLAKVLQRDDRLVSFMREQEKALLNPILQTAQSTESRLKVLVEVLTEME